MEKGRISDDCLTIFRNFFSNIFDGLLTTINIVNGITKTIKNYYFVRLQNNNYYFRRYKELQYLTTIEKSYIITLTPSAIHFIYKTHYNILSILDFNRVSQLCYLYLLSHYICYPLKSA